MNRTLTSRRVAYVILAVALLAAVLAPVGASGGSGQLLYLGMNLHFTGPDTTAGTFVVSGAIADSGTVAVQHIAIPRSEPATRGVSRAWRHTPDSSEPS